MLAKDRQILSDYCADSGRPYEQVKRWTLKLPEDKRKTVLRNMEAARARRETGDIGGATQDTRIVTP